MTEQEVREKYPEAVEAVLWYEARGDALGPLWFKAEREDRPPEKLQTNFAEAIEKRYKDNPGWKGPPPDQIRSEGFLRYIRDKTEGRKAQIKAFREKYPEVPNAVEIAERSMTEEFWNMVRLERTEAEPTALSILQGAARAYTMQLADGEDETSQGMVLCLKAIKEMRRNGFLDYVRAKLAERPAAEIKVSCESFRETVEKRDPQPLSPAYHEAMQNHLNVCPGCQEFMKADTEQTLGKLKKMYGIGPQEIVDAIRLLREGLATEPPPSFGQKKPPEVN